MDYRFIIGLVTVNIVLTVGILLGAYVKFVRPYVEAYFESVEIAKRTTSSAMSALSQKAADVRVEKAMEGDLLQGILDANPELELIAQNVAPEFWEKMIENPRAALSLYERYAPMLQASGMLKGGVEKKTTEYDL